MLRNGNVFKPHQNKILIIWVAIKINPAKIWKRRKKEKRKQLECLKCTNGNSSLIVLNININPANVWKRRKKERKKETIRVF